MSNLNELMRDKERYLADMERAKRLQRLCGNADFHALIVNDFYVRQATCWLNQSCDASLPRERREAILQKAQSTGYLREYFKQIEAQGEEAAARLEELEAYIAREEAQQ